jgi:hypothetical protein
MPMAARAIERAAEDAKLYVVKVKSFRRDWLDGAVNAESAHLEVSLV